MMTKRRNPHPPLGQVDQADQSSLLVDADSNKGIPMDIEPSPTRKSRPGKVNLQLVADLLGKGCTHEQVAAICKCSRQAISYLARQHGLGDVEYYREYRGALLDAKQAQILAKITDAKLEKASARDLGIIYGVLYDKGRLESNQSTSNVSSFARLIESACEPDRRP